MKDCQFGVSPVNYSDSLVPLRHNPRGGRQTGYLLPDNCLIGHVGAHAHICEVFTGDYFGFFSLFWAEPFLYVFRGCGGSVVERRLRSERSRVRAPQPPYP